MVGRADHRLVVLDDDHRVAARLQLAQHGDQPRVVARVQADRRLVEHVEHADEPRADLRGESDALHLAARKGGALAVEGQVVEPHVGEELEPAADLLEHLAGHVPLGLVQLQLLEEGGGGADRPAHDVDDRRAAHGGGARLGPQARALAGGAGLARHVLPQALADLLDLGLGILAPQRRQHALERLEVLAGHPPHAEAYLDGLVAGAVHQDMAELPGQFRVGRREADVEGARDLAQQVAVVEDHAVAAAAPRLDRPILQTDRRVGHDELLGEDQLQAETRAGRAGAVGAVEGEMARLELLEAQLAVRAGVALREERLGLARAGLRSLHDHQPAAPLEGQLDRIGQPRADRGRRHEAVDDHFDGVVALTVQHRRLVQHHLFAVHAESGKPLAPQFVEELLLRPLAPADHRGHQGQLGARRARKQLVDDLLGVLPLDGPPARRAVGPRDVAVEQAQVVVDLGRRRDDRAGIAARGPLLDRDRRREPLDVVDLGLLQLAEELAGIGREALDIAPLPLGIERVEGQRRLARAAQAGDDRQPVPRDADVDVLEIVLARALDQDVVLHGGALYRKPQSPA